MSKLIESKYFALVATLLTLVAATILFILVSLLINGRVKWI